MDHRKQKNTQTIFYALQSFNVTWSGATLVADTG